MLTRLSRRPFKGGHGYEKNGNEKPYNDWSHQASSSSHVDLAHGHRHVHEEETPRPSAEY